MWDIKYRPLKFTDVLGQEGAVAILKSRLKAGTALNTSYIFSGGHGQGKCVRGDTLVPTDRGLLPIQKLMGEHQIDPINVTVAQESGPAKAAYTYRGGVRKTVRLRTYLGYALEGTPEHRIRVMTSEGVIDWKRLGDLAVGDFACIAPYGFFGQGADLSGYQFEPLPADHSSIPFKPPAFLDGHWGRLMGYLAGDGVCATRTDVSVTCADPEIKEDVLRLLDRLGGSGSETLDRRGSSGNANLRCSRVQLRSFLAYLGVDYVGAAKKTIPWAVLASPEPVVAEFLRAYFEADGSASGFVVEAVTKSPELARQVQVLLLSFGILSRRFPKRHPKYGLYWRVRVRRTSLQKFADRIGFISQRKQEALAAILRGDHTTGRRKLENAYDVVPFQARHVAQLYASLPSDLRSSEAGHFLRCRRGKVACTAKQVGYILHHFPPRLTGHFKILADAGFYYDPVVDLSQGECEVYDLNVPDGEMFAANGFMNHNTTLARILARALLCQNLDRNDPEPCNECENCRAFLDEACLSYVELDAASKGTIDNVRSIVDDLAFMPLTGSKRIYLFDEVHRMSRDSQDVLLKPLEEKKMIGIFCTTEPEKIRGTIRSRCEEYSIRKINREDVLARMRMILTKEGVEGDDDAILTVIDYCDGHVRDIINKLGMIAQLGPVTLESVRENLSLSMGSTSTTPPPRSSLSRRLATV
jgi:DNA polymerase III delta prime subunit